MTDLKQAEPDRRDLQAAGTHPAPCARHCEAKAFEIEIRSLKSQLKQQAEPVSELQKRYLASEKAFQQQAEPVAQRSDGMPISKTERELRRMLCIERHGRSAYMDDGEASFCGDKYCRSIDYMRESIESIKQAWYDAGVRKLAGAQPEQQAELLTDKEITDLMPSRVPYKFDGALLEFARAIEAATKSKI